MSHKSLAPLLPIQSCPECTHIPCVHGDGAAPTRPGDADDMCTVSGGAAAAAGRRIPLDPTTARVVAVHSERLRSDCSAAATLQEIEVAALVGLHHVLDVEAGPPALGAGHDRRAP